MADVRSEEEFLVKLTETFREEAKEHLATIDTGLLVLEKPETVEQVQATIETVYREAHSLKGSARAVNHHAVQSICQSLEGVLSAWKQGLLKPSPNLFDVLHGTVDQLREALITPPDESTVVSMRQKLDCFLPKTSMADVEPKLEKLKESQAKSPSTGPELTVSKAEAAVPAAQAPSAPEHPAETTIRISLSKVDRLFQEAEEMLMVKLAIQQELADLKRLLAEFRKREKRWARILADMTPLRDLSLEEPLSSQEQRLLEGLLASLDQEQQDLLRLKETLLGLTRSSQQNTHFVESMVDVLLEDVKMVLMQPTNTLFDAMPRMVRDLARTLGKEVNFQTEGSHIEVDRRVLEEIKDPLIHLIRNAIDHGIESPEIRKQKGKPPTGTLRLIAKESTGGNVEISLSDDGAGFNIEKVKSVAVKHTILTEKEAETISEQEAIKLAFHSGVSTSSMITELSGRGLGLGIVSEKVDNLGGRVLVETAENHGTTFRLILPLTMATFRGIHISVADQDFIMPAHNVMHVLRIEQDAIRTIENQETILIDEHPVAFIHLAHLLEIEQKAKKRKDKLFALIIKSEERLLAFGADQVHHEHEVLVKSLGKPCLRLKHILAATIMEWGKVILILNTTDLVHAAIGGKIMTHTTRIDEVEAKKKLILLVEDSLTTRLLLKNILEKTGHLVKTATDGLEALECLKAENVDLLLTDIEMPNLDGFKLTETVRSMKEYEELPIVICTSLGSNKDRERGVELGANAYIDKSAFTQAELLNIVAKLL